MPSVGRLHILHASGAPQRSTVDYTTLDLVHGYGYHSGSFSRMAPYAGKHNTRLILLNRRDYPGAEPYSDEARRLLLPSTANPDTHRSSMSLFVEECTLEFVAFLAELVRRETIPAAQSRKYGPGQHHPRRVVHGYALDDCVRRAYPLSPHGRALRQYIRRVIFYDTPSTTFGYPRPENVFDPFMLAMQGDRRFLTSDWFSGYFAHGSTAPTLQYKTPLSQPPPALSTLSPAEKERACALAPVSRGGSDQILAFDGYQCGLFREVWQSALYLAPRSCLAPTLREPRRRGRTWRCATCGATCPSGRPRTRR